MRRYNLTLPNNIPNNRFEALSVHDIKIFGLKRFYQNFTCSVPSSLELNRSRTDVVEYGSSLEEDEK